MAKCLGTGELLDVDAGQPTGTCPTCSRSVDVLRAAVAPNFTVPVAAAHVDVRLAEVEARP